MVNNDITRQGVVTDADPMQVGTGDQLAGYNNLIEYINVLKGHPITAPKQWRNFGKIAEGVSSLGTKGLVQLPPVPWYKLTEEDLIKYPYLRAKNISHIGLNGNNRENFYSYLDQPVLGEEVMNLSPKMRDLSIEQAINSSKWEEPQQVRFINANKMPISELRDFQGDFTDQAKKYWKDIESEDVPNAVRGLVGKRPFILKDNAGGWMQEMTQPSGNGEIKWNPFEESQTLAKSKQPNLKSEQDYQEWIRHSDPNPVRRWMTEQMATPEATKYKGYTFLKPEHRLFDLPTLNDIYAPIPKHLDTELRGALPAFDLPIDLESNAVRTFSSPEETKAMMDAVKKSLNN